MNPQTVTGIKVVLIERYARGRADDRLVDEYQLGSVVLTDPIEVVPDQLVERNFSLPFQLVESEVDTFGKKNILFGGLAKAARYFNKVQSEYRVEAEAVVKGVALNPFDRQVIQIK